MVTDAAWIDLNGDGKNDLVVVGEWMPVTVFINANGKFDNKTNDYFAKEYRGWWNKISVGDFNKDGKKDLILGNLGLNSQCAASEAQPAELYYNDFDNNNYVDPILCFYIQGKSYPYVSRDEILTQINGLRKKFTDYKSYADATIQDVLTPEQLGSANRLVANYFSTAYYQMDATGKFKELPLPMQAQFSPVFTITQLDYDKDGNMDILLCGNINHARLRFGKYDANYGTLLHNDGKGGFSYISQVQSGLSVKGDVRSVVEVNNTLLFGINQAAVKAYRFKN
jgi:enediyne biosynthesis protein E4